MIAVTVILFFLAVVVVVAVHGPLLRMSSRITDQSSRVTATIETWKSLLQFLGGLGIFLGVVITWIQLVDSRENFKETIENQTQELLLSEQRVILASNTADIDRFERAVRNLDADNQTVRLSGVLTLEQIASQNPEDYRITISQVLSVFVVDTMSSARVDVGRDSDVLPSMDVVAAINAIQSLRPADSDRRIALDGVNFADTRIPEIDLHSASLNEGVFTNADMRRANLSNSLLLNANLEAANLEGAKLSNSAISNSNLKAAIFLGSDLERATLQESDLSGASLSACYMRGANMERSVFAGTRFIGTILDGANVRGADFSTSEFLTQPQIDTAVGDRDTRLPPTLQRPQHWIR